MNQGQAASFDEVDAVDGLFDDELGVPSDWNGNEELIDLKYHFTMPAGMKRVLAVVQWSDPDWQIDFSTGTGWCPDSGKRLEGAVESDGEITLEHAPGAALATGQWFLHFGIANAKSLKGRSTPFHARLVYLP